MYRQPFETERLKATLERSLGFQLSSLVRLGGGGAINFKAERSSDGFPFVVKCFSDERRSACESLWKVLKAMEGVKTPVPLFAESPIQEAGFSFICLSWQPGGCISPDQLTDGQWNAFLDDFIRFSARMRTFETDDGVRPVRDWWLSARAFAARSLFGRLLRPVLEGMREDELVCRPELTGTVHGDFHRGNLLFDNGKLQCFMDLESFRRGYPVEDICVLLLSTARKLKRSQHDQLQRILSLLGQAVRRLPYSAGEWRTALNALYLSALRKKTRGFTRIGFFEALEMSRRGRLGERFQARVTAEARS